MLPGNAQILTCPHCGRKKEVMSLRSGNTYGSLLWSDNKRISPMLPEISYVQKCPDCEYYYIMARQEVVYDDNDFSSERGLLTFPEMKEAFSQLAKEGFESPKEETNVRMMLHHAFNDYYYRYGKGQIVNEEDQIIFHENGLWLINHLIEDKVMKAEFLREIGEMELAQSTLDSVIPENEFIKNIASAIQERINNNDSKVFKIKED